MEGFNLRPYQDELIHGLGHAFAVQKKRSVLLQCATGGGKTVIASRVLHGVERKGNSGLFLLPRRELVYQTAEKLSKYGVIPGIIMAGEPMNWHRRIQLASFDTLHARAMGEKKKFELPKADVVLVDEAHLSIAETRMAIINAYKQRNALVCGLTATPARGDGKPLGALYDHLILSWPTARMIEEGYLVPVRYVAPSTPDLAGLHTRGGDYVEGELAERMDKPKLIGDIVDNWMIHASNRRTVVFCVTRAHSRHVCEEFKRRGITAEHVDGETPTDERAAIFRRVASGQTQVLCNVFVASYGLDIPVLDCAVLARPTKSLTLYLQIAGRVLRPVYVPGMPLDTVEQRLAAFLKQDALIIDHAGAIDEHGFVDDPVPWTLEGNESISEAKKRQQAEAGEPKEIRCTNCGTVFKGTRFCPSCGHAMIPPGKPVPTYQAELVEITRGADGKRANKVTSWEEKAQFMAEARGYAQEKGFRDGWAANKYRDKFGVWPNDPRVHHVDPMPPGQLIRNWIKHEAIKRARSR
jgi:superfamily II DNA or RNA helicase